MVCGNEKKVKHLLRLRNASTHLTFWKADLAEDNNTKNAFQGCEGAFHVAASRELLAQDLARDLGYIYTSTAICFIFDKHFSLFGLV